MNYKTAVANNYSVYNLLRTTVTDRQSTPRNAIHAIMLHVSLIQSNRSVSAVLTTVWTGYSHFSPARLSLVLKRWPTLILIQCGNYRRVELGGSTP